MHTLRTSSFWKRLALAWFLLTLGVAGASPFVNPKTMELICSSGGAITMVVLDDDGQAQAPVQHTLDCSMCLAPALPLPPVSLAVAQPHPLAAALHPFAAAHIAALVGAPLPPRGPPAQA
ncbi:conserved hypothetical protein [Delftia acidovorans SPH-1]|uniref:DUF2946 domain-containing protein n=1 Tax=Delftia acidovorans (strain DSM 14801 / SPH-1) TaxID=398578 RepID=A9BZD5_DELAS|nr:MULTISPECIES: hypothetical protein [Delftia]MBA4006739.1 DUF2946 domain-containing protein [Delftia sp.]ABX35535.1 conserved hypothetical protein [Delftia acidovorans SPH-1]MBN9322584.1 DUF2946 domain-containing protein [Delftia acidovorans]MCP4014752.1 DUF2946 domain-containing protein [Delftia sp.]MCP4517209.1 DUF2946 domain-containing protein [Delftia sp.]